MKRVEYTRHSCRNCGCYAHNMLLTQDIYIPTASDLKMRNVLPKLQNQVLVCACGTVANRYSMQEEHLEHL